MAIDKPALLFVAGVGLLAFWLMGQPLKTTPAPLGGGSVGAGNALRLDGWSLNDAFGQPTSQYKYTVNQPIKAGIQYVEYPESYSSVEDSQKL